MTREPIHIFARTGLSNLCLKSGIHHRMNLSGRLEPVVSHAYPRATKVFQAGAEGWLAALVFKDPTSERYESVISEEAFCGRCLLLHTAMRANNEESPRNIRRMLAKESK